MNITPRVTYGSLDLTDEPYLWEFGGDLGAPETVYAVLDSLLQDGEQVSSSRKSNRVLTFTVLLEATDMLALADAEAALALECDRPLNVLVFEPGDGWGPATAFDTFPAQMTFDRDDDREDALLRRYVLTIPALPTSRSVDKVITDALPTVVTESVVSVDTCASTTGWTASDSGPTVVSGALKTSRSPTDWSKTVTLWLEKSGSIDLSATATPYLRVDYNLPTSGGTLTLTVDGLDLAPVAISGSYAWFEVPAAVYAKVRFSVTWPGHPTGGRPFPAAYLTVADLSRTNTAGVVGTRRQTLRMVDVVGSARAQGDLTVAHASNALGSVLIYTYPPDLGVGYSPPLQPFYTGAAGTGLSTLVSGSWYALSIPWTCTIPNANLPAGTYELVARLRCRISAGRKTITWSATVAGVTVTGTSTVTITTLNVWQIVTLDMLDLPPVALTGDSTKTITLTLTHGEGDFDAEIDSAWLFHTAGALTWVEAGAELSVSVENATVDTPHPQVWAGDHYAGTGVQGWGRHEFAPPTVAVFAVTTGTEDATITLAHYPRWHTHAGA